MTKKMRTPTTLSLFFLGLVLFAPQMTQARVDFNCFALHGMPMQAFELGNINCPTGKRQRVATNANADVICIYQAICQPLAPGERPTSLTSDQIAQLQTSYPAMASSNFKLSVISCAGKGQVANGNLTFVNCPPPNVCQRDVMYNISFAPNLYPGQNTVSPQPHIDKATQ